MFLAADESAWLTGEQLLATGGIREKRIYAGVKAASFYSHPLLRDLHEAAASPGFTGPEYLS